MIFCDSIAALAYAKDSKYYVRTKHIDVRYHHYIKNIVAQKVVLKYLSMSRMVSNPLTKPIARNTFMAHVRNSRLHKLIM